MQSSSVCKCVCTDGASDTYSDYDLGSSPLSPSPLAAPEDVVDPYPVTITPRLFGGSGRTPAKSPIGGDRAGEGRALLTLAETCSGGGQL